MNRLARLLPPLLLLCACRDGQEREVSSPPPPDPVAALTDTPLLSGDNAHAHCAALCALGPRPSGSHAYAEQLIYLQRQLEQAGWKVCRRPFKLTDGSTMTNLYATFGEMEDTRPLIITCHIDTKRMAGFIGADDGASAAALMLEMARVLVLTPQQAQKIELIFFDGEESFAGRMNRNNSLFGSRFEVLRRQTNNSLPQWQINLDMVGGRDKMIAVPVLDTPPDMVDHYLSAIESLGYSEADWTLYPGSYLDDHTPFADAGVPTLNLIAYFSGSDWWHTTKDNMQRISARSLEESGKLVLRLIGQLLDPVPQVRDTAAQSQEEG